MMQRQKFLKMPERVPLPSVNKKPAQRIPPGGLEDGATAVAFSTSPAMLLRSMREFKTYSLMVKSRAANGMNELPDGWPPLPFRKLEPSDDERQFSFV